VPRAAQETLTCLVVMDRLLDSEEVQEAIASNGGSIANIRDAVRPENDESQHELSGLSRWQGRRSYFNGELSSALATAGKQAVPVSGPALVKAMLETSPSLETRVTPFGVQVSWFDRASDG
jgi:hypothetical protein